MTNQTATTSTAFGPIGPGVIVIPASAIVRLAWAVSTEETRYYLNGWYVHPHACGGANVVATDGHRLGLIYSAEAFFPAGAAGVILARSPELLRAIKPRKSLPRFVVIDAGDGPDGSGRYGVARVVEGSLATTAADAAKIPATSPDVVATINAACIEGTVPEYERVIPGADQVASVPGEAGDLPTFNARYLGEFTAVGADAKYGAPVRVFPSRHAGGPAVVRVSGADDFLGVLMPMRDGIEGPIPAWFRAHPPAAASAKVEPEPADALAEVAAESAPLAMAA